MAPYDWRQFFSDAAKVAFEVGKAYASHQVKEDEIQQLLSLSLEDGMRVVFQSVPPMDNDTCLDFQRRLSVRASTNEKAQVYL